MNKTNQRLIKKKLENLKSNEDRSALEIKNKKSLIEDVLLLSRTMSKDLDLKSIEETLIRVTTLKSREEIKLIKSVVKAMEIKPKNSRQYELSKNTYGIEESLLHLNKSFNRSGYNISFEYNEQSGKVVLW
jgi:hypothetical protein